MGIPIVFSWKEAGGMRRQAEGFTRDISAAGVFIFTQSCPPPHVPVRYDALLPQFSEGASLLRIVGTGRVLRIDESRVGGFAIAGRKVVLRNNDSQHEWLRFSHPATEPM
jgi:hypothetical protein